VSLPQEAASVAPTGAGSVDEELGRAANVLAEAPSVALACHVNPDPDALGSMLGLAGYLASGGTQVVCSWGNQPLARPRWLAALGGDGLIVEADDFPPEPAVMVALDTASPDRLGVLAANADRAGQMIVIDHHRTNPGFGSILLLDPEASSTAELVFRLLERMGGDIPDGAAACLYAGIVADTGRFQYEATSPETLRVAAELRKRPFDHARLAQMLFEDGSLGFIKVGGVAVERAVLVPSANLLWTYILQVDLARAGIEMGETDDMIDLIRTAREADVTCVIKQQRDGLFKVSLRSKGATDVGAVAQAFRGGGHRLAAGYTSELGLEDTVEALVAALPTVAGEAAASDG
jgi:bifunctional oligoribonuclease and PAP phosphatase NrnA